MTKEYFCSKCFSFHNRLGQHWLNSISCSEPELTAEQKEIIIGCLMGDGNINCPEKTPYFRITNTQKDYLEYLDKKLKPFTNGVKLERTSEELAKNKTGIWSDDPSDYKDAYNLKTWCLNQMNELNEWYSSGKKVFPKDIELTPTILKHWFVCDGWYTVPENNIRGRFHIRVNNEARNKEKLNNYFEEAMDISVDYWNGNEEEGQCAIVFFADKTEEIFEYIGEPLPGFEYKWPEYGRK